MGKFIFAMPILLVLVAIGVYFILIPQIYGETISVVDCLLADTKKITSVLRSGNMMMPKFRGIFVLEIFWWIWSALFIASLFFVGKRLQNPDEKFADNAVMIKNEPYIAVQTVLDILKQNPKQEHLEEVIFAVKKLSDRLAIESDFGRGDSNVTDCENNIATLLNSLSTFAENFQAGDPSENAEKIMEVVKNLNSLLSLRSNLEKRR